MHQIELLHTDCMEYMAGLPDKAFDLAIVDPPYGIGASAGIRLWGDKKDAPLDKGWDHAAPTAEYFDELRRVSVDQIIWGSNYFALPPSRGFIFWHKRQSVPNMSAGELAWTSFDVPAKCFDYMWTNVKEGPGDGFKANKPANVHPTQKPVPLYRWLLKNYAKPGDKILDTHLGSGSIAIACDLEGFDLVGCEIDADYIKAARHRLAVHQSAPRLFEATPAGLPQQLSLGDDVLSDGT